MFKKIGFIVALSVLCAGGVRANCYTYGIEAFEEGKYQEAFDIMKPIAEKGGTYVVAYLEYIRDEKLIKNAEFTLPVELPESLHTVSKDWLKASLWYKDVKDAVENPVKKNSSQNKKSKKVSAFSKPVQRKIKELHAAAIHSNFRAFVLIEKLASKNDQIFGSHCLKGKNFYNFISQNIGGHMNPFIYNPNFASIYCRTAYDEGIAILPDETKEIYSKYSNREDLNPSSNFCASQDALYYRELFESGYSEYAATLLYMEGASPCLKNHFREISVILCPESSEDSYHRAMRECANGGKASIHSIKSMEAGFESGKLQDPYNLAQLYEFDIATPDALKKAREHYKFSMDRCQNQFARARYVKMLNTGLGGKKDVSLARKISEEAISQGDFKCGVELAIIYENAKECQKSRNLFKILMGKSDEELATNSRNIQEMTARYALMCWDGTGGDVDFFEAYKMMKKAYKLGVVRIIGVYADMTERGQGCKADLDLARRLYLESIEKENDPQSMCRYAYMCFEGRGGERDYVEAVKWAEEAVRAGHSDCLGLLADAYFNGLGTGKNLKKARDLFYLNATQNQCRESMAMYAQMCWRGLGGQKSLSLAGE